MDDKGLNKACTTQDGLNGSRATCMRSVASNSSGKQIESWKILRQLGQMKAHYGSRLKYQLHCGHIHHLPNQILLPHGLKGGRNKVPKAVQWSQLTIPKQVLICHPKQIAKESLVGTANPPYCTNYQLVNSGSWHTVIVLLRSSINNIDTTLLMC